MKNFIMQFLGALVILLGGSFFLKGKFKNFFKKKSDSTKIPKIKPLQKPPDVAKIKEEFKNETPKESVDRVNNLFDELFPGD